MNTPTLPALLAYVRREALVLQKEVEDDDGTVHSLRVCAAMVVRHTRHQRGQELPPYPRITRRERERRATLKEQRAARALVDAALEFRRALTKVSDSVLLDGYTKLARLSQDSSFADSHEPLARLAEAVLTEQKQRNLKRTGEA